MSYADIRTFEGVVHETFKDAATARGLLEDDLELDHCLEEAAGFSLPAQMRELFSTILVWCSPLAPHEL